MLSREDCRQGHHDKLDVGNGHARPLCLCLCILQHYDSLGDAIHLDVILVHVGAEGDHVNGVEPLLLASRKVMISRADTLV
jgi:hypothetical protein